jgi:hypothetical protein
MKKKLLLVDNHPAHPQIENLSKIKLVFLPPNATSASFTADGHGCN